MNLFTGLNGEGKTIILVTHEPAWLNTAAGPLSSVTGG